MPTNLEFLEFVSCEKRLKEIGCTLDVETHTDDEGHETLMFILVADNGQVLAKLPWSLMYNHVNAFIVGYKIGYGEGQFQSTER